MLERYTYCLNNPLKYTDPSEYSREAILRDMEEDRKNALSCVQFFNKYPFGWEEYVERNSHKSPNYSQLMPLYREAQKNGYNEDLISFQNELYKQLSIPYSVNSQTTFTWHTWLNSNQVMNGEVIVSSEKINYSVTINAQSGEGSGGESSLLTSIGGTGYGNHALGYWAEKTADITYKYGQRVNGVVKNAALITAENSALWGKVALRFNVAGGVLGAGVNGYKMVNDFSEGNYAKGGFEAAKTASYTFGLYLLAVNPAVGGVWLLGTGLVDLGGDIYEHFSKE